METKTEEIYDIEEFIELVKNNLLDESGYGFYAHDEFRQTDIPVSLDIEELEAMSEFYECVWWYT